MTYLIIIIGLAGCKNESKVDTSLTTVTKKQPLSKILKKEKTEITQKDIAMLMGKFEPKSHPDFVLIDKKYADRPGLYLQKDAYTAFIKMYKEALKSNIRLQIRSATRNFDYQKGIWERKWNGTTKVNGKNLEKSIKDPVIRAKEILKYSSMPGSSRHHWGTDIDLNSFDNAWFGRGKGKVLYDWMLVHAMDYGYCQVYTDKQIADRTGYEEEKWHWSYLPSSKLLTKMASKSIKDDMFKGFKGSDAAIEVKMVENYILGINERCK